jgi:hypothetical protein
MINNDYTKTLLLKFLTSLVRARTGYVQYASVTYLEFDFLKLFRQIA